MDKQKLIDLYENLLLTIEEKKDEFIEKKVSVFNVGVGVAFNKELLVFGRATNGWCPFDKTDLINNKLKIIDNINNDNLTWVIDLFNSPDEDWNPHKSAFWRLIKKFSSELFNDESYEVINNIAWSNIYKISNASKGNPSQKLMSVQIDTAKEILKTELDIFQPKIAIFLTSLRWARPFLNDLSIEKITTRSDFKYVELIGKYNNTIIIVGQHPQGKPEDEQKNEILTGIKLAKEYFGFN